MDCLWRNSIYVGRYILIHCAVVTRRRTHDLSSIRRWEHYELKTFRWRMKGTTHAALIRPVIQSSYQPMHISMSKVSRGLCLAIILSSVHGPCFHSCPVLYRGTTEVCPFLVQEGSVRLQSIGRKGETSTPVISTIISYFPPPHTHIYI